jgi:hypothetical protein
MSLTEYLTIISFVVGPLCIAAWVIIYCIGKLDHLNVEF